MGNGMNMGAMTTSSVSLSLTFFWAIIVVLYVVLIVHIIWTLWKRRGDLGELKQRHSNLVHSVPMSLGLITTMAVCLLLGTLMKGQWGQDYIICFLLSLVISGSMSLPFKNEIALLDGLIAGTMGGIMGVMMAEMIPELGLTTFILLLTLLFGFTWFILYRHIHYQIKELQAENKRDAS